MAKKIPNTDTTKKSTRQVFVFDQIVCNYIKEEWLDATKSNLSQSQNLGIHPHVLRKIRDEDGYRIPLSTLAIMCFYRGEKLSDFFNTIERKYGNKINDDFIEKK